MSDNLEKIEKFSDIVDSKEFQFKYEKLVEEDYYASPLLNKVEGYREFERLEKEDYFVVKLKKKPENKQNGSPMKKLIKEKTQNQQV